MQGIGERRNPAQYGSNVRQTETAEEFAARIEEMLRPVMRFSGNALEMLAQNNTRANQLRTRENNERIARLENSNQLRNNTQAIEELINLPPARPGI